MHLFRHFASMFAACAVLGMAACSGDGGSSGFTGAAPATVGTASADAVMRARTPKAIAPDRIPAAPMTLTRVLSPADMTRRTPKSAIAQLGWSQLPGAAQNVAASPDGSLWAVSSAYLSPGGNTIWHYVNGSWSNIPGAALRLSVGPDGSLWAINGSGAIYHYVNGVWSTIAGGASDLSVAPDGSLYVISSAYGGLYGNAIYHYVNGVWTQLPGAGSRIAASWDTGTYAGITPGGFYVVNGVGSIYYYNPASGFVQLPGAAAQVAPTTAGGLFALGYPLAAAGDPLYYNNLASGVWTAQAGAGLSLSSNTSRVYVAAGNTAIYTAPVVAGGSTGAPFSLSASVLNFTGLGAANALTFNAIAAVSGNLAVAASSSCLTSGTASITPQAAAVSATFTVTPVAAGTCSFTITDSAGNHGTVQVNVTTTSIISS